MKHLPNIVGVLLGLLFLLASVPFLLHMVPPDTSPEGTPMAFFRDATGPTGYMTFVKVLELAGGVLVMIPKLRNIGLLILGPILVNIFAYHVFIAKGALFFSPPPLTPVAGILALYLLWAGRRDFAALVR